MNLSFDGCSTWEIKDLWVRSMYQYSVLTVTSGSNLEDSVRSSLTEEATPKGGGPTDEYNGKWMESTNTYS